MSKGYRGISHMKLFISCMNLRTQIVYKCWLIDSNGQVFLKGIYVTWWWHVTFKRRTLLLTLRLGVVGTCQLEKEIAWNKSFFFFKSQIQERRISKQKDPDLYEGQYLSAFLIYYVSAYLISESRFHCGPLGNPTKMLKSLPQSNIDAYDKNDHMLSNYFIWPATETQIWQEIIV